MVTLRVSIALLLVGIAAHWPAEESAAQERLRDIVLPSDGFVTVNGIKLHYVDWGGGGEGLLFIPGKGPTAHFFDFLAPRFTDQFRVLGLTRRGAGKSAKPKSGYD